MTELLRAGMPATCLHRGGTGRQDVLVSCSDGQSPALDSGMLGGNRDVPLPAVTGMAACLCTCINHTLPKANQPAIIRSVSEGLFMCQSIRSSYEDHWEVYCTQSVSVTD